jgi:hypothetical protein
VHEIVRTRPPRGIKGSTEAVRSSAATGLTMILPLFARVQKPCSK